MKRRSGLPWMKPRVARVGRYSVNELPLIPYQQMVGKTRRKCSQTGAGCDALLSLRPIRSYFTRLARD